MYLVTAIVFLALWVKWVAVIQKYLILSCLSVFVKIAAGEMGLFY